MKKNRRSPDNLRLTDHSKDISIQLTSFRKKTGLSQKELARRVGTSQQQISRLESPSYEGHSVSMLRRVAEALGATIHIEIQKRTTSFQWLAAEGKPPYGDNKTELVKFETDVLRKDKINHGKNIRTVDALHYEAVALGAFPLRDPLEGIEVDLKIAKVVNSV